MIECKKVTKSFDSTLIFKDLELSINHCGIHVIVGESGSGKSTLLNMLAGFESVSSGSIHTDGTIATIFQNYELIQSLNVRDNIYLAHEITQSNVTEKEMIIEKLGLESILDHYPNECSGGQKQRIGIARALFQNPSIILCDEPTESLDQENKQMVMQLFKEISKHCMIIVATHDPMIVEQYADQIYTIKNHTLQKTIVRDRDVINLPTSKPDIDIQQVNTYLKKILVKKSLLFSFVIALLCGGAFTLYGIEKMMFQANPSLDAVSKNRIYVQSKIENYDFNAEELNAKPIFEATSLFYEGKNDRFLMVPYVNNSLSIEGTYPNGLTICINQNVAERFSGDPIGQTIKVKYKVNSVFYDMDVTISGIIEEKDIEREAVYYDEASFINYFKKNNTRDGQPLYDSIYNQATYFQVIAEYENMDEAYQRLQENSKLIFESPLYDEQVKEKQQKQVYQIAFQVAEMVLMVGIIMTMLIYVSLDTKHAMKDSSIFVALGVPVEIIKKENLKLKIQIFTIVYLIVLIFQQFLFQLFTNYSLTISERLFEIGSGLLVYFIYLGVLLFLMRKLKQERINEILKDNQDNG